MNKFLFLWGPPGSGKTLMLTLRAQRWVSEGGRVVILNMRHGSLGLPLGHLLQKQVCECVVCVTVGTDGVCARNWPAAETGV